MGNVFLNLPVNINAAGAPVDTSLMGRRKEVVVTGSFTGGLIIQASTDGGTVFFPVKVVTKPGTYELDLAATDMRVVSQNAQAAPAPFSPEIDMGAPDDGIRSGVIPAPAAPNTVGAPLDISAFGEFSTIIVGGSFTGLLVVEVSEDGSDWSDLVSFQAPGAKSLLVTGQEVRIRSKGATAGATFNPTFSMASVNEGGSGGAGRPATVFVYRPGGTAVDNVYTDWATLVAALAQVEGFKVIEMDATGTAGSAFAIPAGGPYDMSDCEWYAGTEDLNDVADSLVEVQIPEGATFTKLRRFRGEKLGVAVQATGTVPDESVEARDVIILSDGAQIAIDGGSVPMWDCVNLGSGDRVTVLLRDLGSFLGAQVLLNMPVSGSLCTLNIGTGSRINGSTIAAVAGCSVTNARQVGSSICGSQPAILGNFIELPLAYPQLFVDTAAQAADVNMFVGHLARFDTTATDRAANLPGSIQGGAGDFVAAINEVGANNVNLTPAGGDSVIGGTVLAAGETAMLVSDGLGNWIRLV